MSNKRLEELEKAIEDIIDEVSSAASYSTGTVPSIMKLFEDYYSSFECYSGHQHKTLDAMKLCIKTEVWKASNKFYLHGEDSLYVPNVLDTPQRPQAEQEGK